MQIPKEELSSVLSQFNPWWRDEPIKDLPSWQRAAFGELSSWTCEPPAQRAVLLSGARQVGKTTLVLQTIQMLLARGVPPQNIVYTTFDHPIMKLAGIEKVLESWRERVPNIQGTEYLFLDEAQFINNFGTWVKHQVDFNKSRRIVFTGSAMPLIASDQESGVGRWHTIRITTLSFYEYLQIKKIPLPNIPYVKSLKELFKWPQHEFYKISELAQPYMRYFHEYLIRGGFPQTALVSSTSQAQRLLREDIIEKALKRDMTALFGVRRILELEQLFLYICMHNTGQLDMGALCSNLQIKRPTIQNYLELLEATHLLYKLAPYGYGKEILRAHYKIYLADAAMPSAVLLRGDKILENPEQLANATEAAVFKHLFARYYKENIRFTYWQNKKNQEVDIIAEFGDTLIPFEIKYRTQNTDSRYLLGLKDFCASKNISHGYVVTKETTDFGLLNLSELPITKIIRIPAILLCYWMGYSEIEK